MWIMKFQSLFRSVLCNSALETKHFCSPLPSYTHHRSTKNYHPAITTPVKNAFCFWGKATKKTEKQKTNVTKLLDRRFLLSAIQSLEISRRLGSKGVWSPKQKKPKAWWEKVNLFASSNCWSLTVIHHPDAQSPIDQRWIVKALFSLGWVVPDKWSHNASLTKKTLLPHE